MVEEQIRQLKSGDPAQRREAAWNLSGTDARAIHPLIKALWDESPGVQEAAMNSLGSFTGEEIVWAVLPLLREDAPRRNMALEILTRIGEEAVPLMRERIVDKDPDVRKFVIDVFGAVGGETVVPTLLQSLEDENANVRAAGAKALGQLRVRDSVPALVRRLEDEEWVAFGALEALGNIADENAVNAIAALLDGASSTLRAMAIEALGEIRSPLGSRPLFAILDRLEPGEQQMAARSLVRIGVNDTNGLATVLIHLLEDGDDEDRSIAVDGLVALRSRAAVPRLVELAGAQETSIPEQEELYRKLLEGLVAIGDEGVLIRMLSQGDLKYRARVVLIDVLGRLGSRKAVKALVDCLRSGKREVRRAAARAGADIAEPDASGPLLERLNDEDGHVRRSAARALGMIGEEKALSELLEIAKKETYPDVLEEVVEAAAALDAAVLKRLARSRRPEVRRIVARLSRGKAVRPLLKDEDPAVRTAATLSLGMNEWPEAPSLLAALRSDPDVEVRKAAVRGLGQIGDTVCREALRRCLADRDMWVRMFAVDALSDLGDAEGVAEARQLLSDTDVPVRMAALRYLGRLGSSEDIEPALSDGNAQVRGEAQAAMETARNRELAAHV